MEILSYPVGLVIGLFPVIVDLSGQPGPARLSLDGRPVCEVTAKAPACMIDLGPDPRIHKLDLERLDRNGKVVEEIHRWVNRPTPEGRVRAVGSCEEKKRECEFQVQWAHPARLDPQTLTVALDGKRVGGCVSEIVRVPFPRAKIPQVFTVEAVFPDGQRAEYTQLLHGINPEEARASLHPIAIEVPRSNEEKEVEARLREAGWKIRAIDEGEVEILFVIQPKAISRFAMTTSEVSANPVVYGGALEGLGPLHFVVADETLALLAPSVVGERRERWLPAMMTMSSRGSLARVRIADAVAAGAYRLGGVSRRRMMVLVLGPHEILQEDSSAVSPAQALAYLKQVSVPLVVWRIDVHQYGGQQKTIKVDADRKDWPEGEWIHSSHDFPRVISRLREVIDRQRLVWLEEDADTAALDASLPAGFAMAGGATETVPELRDPGPPPPPRRTVYAVAPDPNEPGAIYAATAGGLLQTCDSGETWARVETGNPGGVFSLAFAGADKTRLLGGGSGALFRSATNTVGWSGLSLPTVFSLGIDPGNPSVIYAGTRGRIFKSEDAGLNWAEVSGGVSSFALALAVQPGDSAVVYAGTAGGGVFKSTDGGKSWEEAGKELQTTAVRSLAIDPANSKTLYAGTDGGIFVSINAGKSWTSAGPGFPRAITYALAVDPRRPKRLIAGTSAGLFVSENRAGSWRRAPGPAVPVTSLAFEPQGRLIAGTLGEGVIVLPAEELEAGKEPAVVERQESELPDGSQQIPPGILPSSAKGPRLPLGVDLSNVERRGFHRSAKLTMTLRIKPIFEAMTKKAPARLSVKVVAESPAARTTVRESGGTVDFDETVETWTLEVPVEWSVNTTRLIVTVVERVTGAHGVATIEPPED